MSLRQSARLQGTQPAFTYNDSEQIVGRRRQREEDINESLKKQAIENNDTFSFSRPKERSYKSEPVIGTKKEVGMPSQAITEKEEIIPLTKDEILRILSRDMPMDKASIVETFMKKSNIVNQEVPSIYSSYFFRKDIIKIFEKELIASISPEKIANFPLSVLNLYNKDDILNNTVYKPDEISTRFVEKTSGYTTNSLNNMQKVLTFLSKEVCSNIGEEYAKNAVERAVDLMKNEEKFDILVASTRVITDVTLPIEKRLNGVVAFIIVELGECKKYPSAYSINLICTNTNQAIPGTGSILMGAFLYTILSHPKNLNPLKQVKFPNGNSFLKVTSKKLTDGSVIENATFTSKEPLVPVQHIAVLELALAYTNTGGLCMYEKFGFKYDQSMFSNPNSTPPVSCFDDRDNLPMLINFDTKPGYAELSLEEKKQKIIKITAGNDKGFDKSKICNVRGDAQRLLGQLKSIQLYLDNSEGSSPNDYKRTSEEGRLITQLKNLNNDPINTGLSKNNSRYSITKILNEITDYMENPPQPDNLDIKNKVDILLKLLPPKTGGRLTRKHKRHYYKQQTRKIYEQN
jgi:hypothetical protein